MPWNSIHIPCSLPSTSKSSTPRFQFRFNFRSQIPNSIASFESLPNTCPCLRKYQILILNLSLDISLTPPCVPRPNIKVKSNSKLLFPPNQFSQQKFKIPPSTFVGRIPSLGPFPLSARFPLPFPRAPHVSRSGERDPSLSLCSLSLIFRLIRFSPHCGILRAPVWPKDGAHSSSSCDDHPIPAPLHTAHRRHHGAASVTSATMSPAARVRPRPKARESAPLSRALPSPSARPKRQGAKLLSLPF